MTEFVCKCGGRLEKQDDCYVCENCRNRYKLGKDEEGYEFFYEPVEKKIIECGQVSTKASSVITTQLTVHEIRLSDDAEVQILKETHSIPKNEAIRLIKVLLSKQEWENANEPITGLKKELCGEGYWLGLLCKYKATDDEHFMELIATDFTGEMQNLVDKAFENSPLEFVKEKVNLFLKSDFTNDICLYNVLSVIIPYANNDRVLSERDRLAKYNRLLTTVINRGYCKSFELLLSNILKSNEVDDYIEYHLRFVKNCPSQNKKTYLNRILEVDPGNVEALRLKLFCDLDSSTLDECIRTFENLLSYTAQTDEEVINVIIKLSGEAITTEPKSKFIYSAIGYHSESPQGLKKELLSYAYLLLNSSLFEEAKSYFNLVLSFERNCAEAFEGLCYVSTRIRNKNEIEESDNPIKNCPEFNKYLSLLSDEDMKNFLNISKNQERAINRRCAHKKRKRFIIIGSVITAITIIALIVICTVVSKINYAKKYDVNNVVVSITDKERTTKSNGSYLTVLKMTVNNGSTLEILEIKGTMKVYHITSGLLLTSTVTLSGELESITDSSFSLDIDERDSEEMRTLYNADLDDLQITFQITHIIYEGYEGKDYPDSNENVIVNYSDSINSENNQPQKDVAIGDTVTLGQFETNCDFNTTESMEWLVVKKEGDLVLLISKMSLLAMPYGDYSQEDYVSWKNSEIRNYLNGTFYYTCFTETERNLMSTTIITPSDDEIEFGAIQTSDIIFIPSWEEMCEFFYSTNDMSCNSTGNIWGDSAPNGIGSISHDDFNTNCTYWLRGAIADSYGSPVQTIFLEEDNWGNNYSGVDVTTMYNDSYYIRPCLWIDLSNKQE